MINYCKHYELFCENDYNCSECSYFDVTSKDCVLNTCECPSCTHYLNDLFGDTYCSVSLDYSDINP